MSPKKPFKIAILWRGDAEARQAATRQNNRFHRIFEELAAVGIDAEPAVYDEPFADEVREQREMENRIKECQLDLYADRTSAQTMRANQLRLWFASMAYVLLAVRLAPHRPRQHSVRPRVLRHHPPQAAEDWRACAHQRAPHQARHAHRLPLSGRVPRRARRADGLTNQTAPPTYPSRGHTIPRLTCPSGLVKVETNRFNPQPPLSSCARPSPPAPPHGNQPAVRNPG
jgi:hypothetical protein